MKVEQSMAVGIGALTVAAAVAAAQLGPGPGRRGPGPGPMAAEMRYLQLSDEQQTEFERVLEAQRPQREALHERMRANRDELREALDSPTPDAQIVGEIVIEGEKLRKEGRALREDASQALDGVLTPEQKRRREVLEAARALGPGRRPAGLGMPPLVEGPAWEGPR